MVPASLLIVTGILTIILVVALYIDPKLYRPYGKIIVLLSLFFILVTILAYAFLAFIVGSPDTNNVLTNLEKAVQFSGGAITLGSLIGSIVIWRESIRYQMRQTIINQFELFRADRYDKTRKQAWEVWLKWNDTAYRDSLLNAYFDKSAVQIDEEHKAVETRRLKKELRRLRDILEFYNGLLPYKSEAATMIECKYLFYDWWRPFLYDFAAKCDEHYKASDQLKSDQYDQYLNNTSYIKSLNKLDKLFGFEKFKHNFEFHPRKKVNS